METSVLKNLRVQSVFDAGFFLHDFQRDPNLHSHLNHELYFVESGACTARCADTLYTLDEGDLLLINAGTEHSVCHLTADASVYSLRFSFYTVGKETENTALFAALSAPIHLKNATALVELLGCVRLEMAEQRPLYGEKLSALLRLFYVELVRRLTDSTPLAAVTHPFSIEPASLAGKWSLSEETPQDFYMETMDEFFTHLSPSNATLSELARRLYLSISQTQRLVKRYYGVSFQKKLIEAKVMHACRLIVQTSLSLEQIAADVGYDSYNAFFKAFVAETGHPPSTYRAAWLAAKNEQYKEG